MTGDIVPRTRGWQAAATASDPPVITVTGEIELGNENEVPRLGLSEPQGLDASVLTLDVEIATGGPSELAMHWAPIEFRHPLPEPRPSRVRVMWMGIEVAILDITV
jgi:hypothetical protein